MRPPRTFAAVALAVGPLLSATHCATLFHGSRQGVTVATRPAGAEASAGDQRVTTPGTLEIPRKRRGMEIRLEKPGYRPQILSLERTSSPLVWANGGFLAGGILLGLAAAIATNLSDTGEDYGSAGFIVGGLLGTAIGVIVDLQTGAAYRQVPARIDAPLEPEP
jgi:hypothetical protein